MRGYAIRPGDLFGRWRVVGEPIGGKVLCRCECGVERTVTTWTLRGGRSESCGCARREASAASCRERSTTHGMYRTPTNNSWASMIKRCNDPNQKSYANYGGRGIAVCDRWRTFERFLADMGERPSLKHSIDRIDRNGNYEPGNCRWATAKEQARNRRTSRVVEVAGVSATLAEWQERSGIGALTIRARLDRGWSAAEAVTVPAGGRR